MVAEARVSQLARQVLGASAAQARIAQHAREVLLSGITQARVTQAYRQALRSRRDAPYPNFPVRLFSPPALTMKLEGAGLGGAVAPAGDEQLTALETHGRWVMDFAEAPLWDKARILSWREFAAACDFGAMPVIVPAWELLHQPYGEPILHKATTFAQIVWRDIQTWDAFEVQAISTAHSARFDTSVTMSFVGTGALEGGMHFSIYGPRYGWRLYRVIRETAVSGSDHTWEIRPALREQLMAGTELNFDTPRCTMRCDGDIDAVVDLQKFGRGAARFVETFDRYP